MKPCLENLNCKSAYLKIFSELLYTDKEEFRCYLWLNTTCYYWPYIDFYTLITYTSYITYICTYTYTSCTDYNSIIDFYSSLKAMLFIFTQFFSLLRNCNRINDAYWLSEIFSFWKPIFSLTEMFHECFEKQFSWNLMLRYTMKLTIN